MHSFQKQIKTTLVLIIFFLASLSNVTTAIGAAMRYSTYLGGSGNDIAYGIVSTTTVSTTTVATTTWIYITGTTNSEAFATSTTGTSTTKDVFVTKMDLTGTSTSIIFTTYLRGSGDDEGRGIAIDSDGDVYVTGFTSSTDFTTTTPGILSTGTRTGTDAFIAKISPTGVVLYSTLLGGNTNDEGLSIAVDSSKNAYVTGKTFSPNFPTTPSPLQASCAAGTNSDAFITKVDLDGALSYSTCLGGSSGGDIGHGIAVDNGGNAYVTGETASTNFPTSLDALQRTNIGSTELSDAFFTKVAPMGTSTIYSTYLGGMGTDAGYAIAVNGTDVYITGETNSPDIGTSTVTQDFESGVAAGGDIFIANIDLAFTDPDEALANVIYLVAGKGLGITVDSAGNLYVTGETSSTSFPTTPGATQASNADATPPTTVDAFVSKIDATGTFFLFSTYLGGNSNDYGRAIAIDADGNAYVAGQTDSTDFKVLSPLQGSSNGPADMFITKFDTVVNPSAPVPIGSGGGGSGGGGGCFIATAAYGSYLDPHVMVLRTFRDRYLSTNVPGRFFVQLYYRHSPPLADYISRHEGIRMIVRWGLTPIIYAIAYPIFLPIFALMIFALLTTLCLRPELNRHAPKREGF